MFKVTVLLLLYLNKAFSDICTTKKLIFDTKDEIFEKYLQKYEVKVPDEAIKEKYRSQFYRTLREVEEFNSKPGNFYEQTINKFAHLSMQEIIDNSLGLSLLRMNYPKTQKRLINPDCEVKPIDWRKTKGAVAPVKDQGTCGNCFIFAAVGAIESQTFIKTNKSYVLSEQYAMDCLSKFRKINNDACLGGQPDYIFELVITKRGLPLNVTYKYKGTDLRTCPNVPLAKDAAIKSYTTLSTKNEDNIVCMLQKGPVTAAIFVNTTFTRYSRGIYDDSRSCKPTAVLNHAVVIVGYGKDAITGMEYYIVRNSWGTNFGEDGYIRMKKGINLCGIANYVQQPSFEEQLNIFSLFLGIL